MLKFLIALSLIPLASAAAKTCPAEWILFERPQGNWCVKVFFEQRSQDEAEYACKLNGGRLTGPQNTEERLRIGDSARDILISQNLAYGNVRVGATRINCIERTKPTSDCVSGSLYKWTDGHTINTDGFHFSGVVGFDDCAVIQTYRDTGANYYSHSLLTNFICEKNGNANMYVCGKDAA